MTATPDAEDPTQGGDYVAGGRPLTGRRALAMLLAFFGVCIAVNMTMLYFARSTFSGLVTTASFREGVKYDREIAAARAQDDRGWKVDAQLAPASGGRTRVEVRALDRDGKPLTGLSAAAKFSHPADTRHDILAALRETSPGVYVGDGDPAPGAWTLVLELGRGGERLFLSRNRASIGS